MSIDGNIAAEAVREGVGAERFCASASEAMRASIKGVTYRTRIAMLSKELVCRRAFTFAHRQSFRSLTLRTGWAHGYGLVDNVYSHGSSNRARNSGIE